jgi:hypothetical protein
MGLSESGLKIMVEPFKTCITQVFGSFDCTCKSKCCDYYKVCNCYHHCRTIDESTYIESDDEIILNDV